MGNGASGGCALPFRLQNCRSGLYSKLRSEFLKLRRWSLGLRRWTRNRTRQGEPGDEERKKSESRRKKCLHFLVHNSCFLIPSCQLVTVVLRCRKLSSKTRMQPQRLTPYL